MASAVQVLPSLTPWSCHFFSFLGGADRCKKFTETDYFFLELFADQAAIEFHGGGDTFAAMGKRQKEARANDRSRKAKFTMGKSRSMSPQHVNDIAQADRPVADLACALA